MANTHKAAYVFAILALDFLEILAPGFLGNLDFLQTQAPRHSA